MSTIVKVDGTGMDDRILLVGGRNLEKMIVGKIRIRMVGSMRRCRIFERIQE